MTRRITAKDIAMQAGVSRSAVSRAFTKGASVKPETRTRILDVAENLGYRPNAIARSLIKQETDLVAVVTGSEDNIYDMYFFDRLALRLQHEGKWGLLVRAERDEDISKKLGEALMYPVQAAIVRAGTVNTTIVEQCQRLKVPLIFTGPCPVAGADSVWCDNEEGARLAVDTLIQRGCRKIAYLGGDIRMLSENSRRKGFFDAMKTFGLEPFAVLDGDFYHADGYSNGVQLLTARDVPDGIFCANDAAAMGVLDAAKQVSNLRVPEQLAVIGFDNIPMAAWPSFDLTTIDNPIDLTTQAVADTLKKRLDAPGLPEMSVAITPKLVLRGSA